MTVDTLHKTGHILFEFAGEPELMDVHIFCTDSIRGTPTESDGESTRAPGSLPLLSAKEAAPGGTNTRPDPFLL